MLEEPDVASTPADAWTQRRDGDHAHPVGALERLAGCGDHDQPGRRPLGGAADPGPEPEKGRGGLACGRPATQLDLDPVTTAGPQPRVLFADVRLAKNRHYRCPSYYMLQWQDGDKELQAPRTPKGTLGR